ncbi:MAG: diacylglycerol kinase [Candidatus Saccharibacteria bacterium]|nr:diacylglycerol kinase [Candidatus Saccharibacteria bacterium]
MRTAVFINAHSRQAKKNLTVVREYFDRSDCPFEVIDFIVVKRLGKLDNYIDRLTAHTDIECVIVGSGDGTITAVFNALRERKDIIYGFLPLGTGNVFVRSLGLPTDVQEVLGILEQQYCKDITLGEVNDTLFGNMAAIGMSARIAANISDRTKLVLGQGAYLASGIKELLRHRAFTCEIDHDGKHTEIRTHHLIIANGSQVGSVVIGKQASLYKDQLLLVSLGEESRIDYLKSLLRLARGKIEEHETAELIPFTHAQITTYPVRNIEIDGEVMGKTPLVSHAHPKAVKVIVPEKRD